jgi:integrase
VSRLRVFDDLRVQEVVRSCGRLAYTILWPDGSVHRMADGFLRTCTPGTSKTYGYLLLDHLRWLRSEGLDPESVGLRDVQRYMGAVGAEYLGPFGAPWRVGKRPYGQSALETAAACLKRFYLYQGSQEVNRQLAKDLDEHRLPTKADRQRSFLGHTLATVASNPLTPTKAVRRRHPKMLPEGTRTLLAQDLKTARDRMVVAWLADGGFRIGELCGLHLVDLHLRENAACGECRLGHVHICHREGNANRSRAKTKQEWRLEGGIVRGGTVRRASPAMVSSYFEYMTTEYPAGVGHGMLLVQLAGPRIGQPLSPDAVRGVLRRSGARLELGRVKPHQFRHSFATAVLDASGGNSIYARDAGGWASAVTVDETYGHADVHDPAFAAALERSWETP